LVAFLFMAVTSSIISIMLLRFNDKYQVSWWVQQAVTMFCMWIKSHILTENASFKQWQRLTKSRYCPRYYTGQPNIIQHELQPRTNEWL
jgi:hypothetical protein